MTPAEYERLIEKGFAHPQIKDAWIGPWMVKRLWTRQGYQYQADHAACVGATAGDVATLAVRMATWDAGMAAMGLRRAA